MGINKITSRARARVGYWISVSSKRCCVNGGFLDVKKMRELTNRQCQQHTFLSCAIG